MSKYSKSNLKTGTLKDLVYEMCICPNINHLVFTERTFKGNIFSLILLTIPCAAFMPLVIVINS